MPETPPTIVIPVHNEADFMDSALPVITRQLEEAVGPEYRIILVENGSTDQTPARAAAWAAQDPRIRTMELLVADYGQAVRRGMEAAVGENPAGWVILFDLDYFSGEFAGYATRSEADVVVASKRGAGSVDKRSPMRRFATRVFAWCVRAATGSKLSDTHGIKAVRAPVAARLLGNVEQRDDLFDTELVIRAELSGCRIEETPIAVEELRASRSSLIRRVPRTLRGLLALRRSLRRNPPRPGAFR